MVNNLCVFLSALRSFFVSVVSFMLPGAASATDGCRLSMQSLEVPAASCRSRLQRYTF